MQVINGNIVYVTNPTESTFLRVKQCKNFNTTSITENLQQLNCVCPAVGELQYYINY